MITGRPTHMPDPVPSGQRSVQSATVPAVSHGRSRTYRVRELAVAGR